MRFKKILLVNPPKVDQGGYKPSPLGILYLAAYLGKYCSKIEVKIVDGAIEGEKAVLKVLSLFKPDLVGISSLTPGRHQALWVAKKAKHLVPDCKVVLGNVHPTIMWKQMMETYQNIDFIIRGEGEETLFELATGKSFKTIKGLVWKNQNKVIDNPVRLMIQNLDSLPFPAWNLVNPRSYPSRGEGLVNGVNLKTEVRFPLIFSRGCMGTCTFCSSWMIWKGYRYRSGKLVADEIEMLYKTYKAKHFVFQDDTLTGNRDEIIIFCKEIIRKKLQVAIYGTTRVDKVDLEMLRFMKKSGFYQLSFGIESGSPLMLTHINKHTNLDKIKRAVSLTKKAGIRACALMMYGLPRETHQDIILSKKLLNEIKPDETGSVGAVWVFPGTALYEQAKNSNLIDDSFWLSKKKYYIYRGGIGGDNIHYLMRIKDELWHLFGETFIWKFFTTLNVYKIKAINKLFTYLQ